RRWIWSRLWTTSASWRSDADARPKPEAGGHDASATATAPTMAPTTVPATAPATAPASRAEARSRNPARRLSMHRDEAAVVVVAVGNRRAGTPGPVAARPAH